jgi:protein ImuB
MRLTDARALDPKLLAEPADPAGDAALLKRLARWAGRWSPLVEADGGGGLRLDVSGIAHLFGGEEALVADMQGRFAALGLTARVAIAPTAAAAWALARYSKTLTLPPLRGGSLPLPHAGEGDSAAVERGEGLLDLLSPLPVAALRLEARSVQILERLGLKTIGQLAGVPRKSLQRRFRETENPFDALDRALGRRDGPLTAAPHEPGAAGARPAGRAGNSSRSGAQALERLVPALAKLLSGGGWCAAAASGRLPRRRQRRRMGVATAIPSRDSALFTGC